MQQRSWADYSPEEKLIAIEGYLDGMVTLENEESGVRDAHIAWLREHLPARGAREESNYVFISYAHRNYKEVYHDLAMFRYNSETRVRFWYDEGLPAGQSWEEAARAHVEDPRCVGAIFYLSEEFLTSPACLSEIRMIRETGKPYVTVSLSRGRYAAADFLKKEDAAYDELCRAFPKTDTALTYGADFENVLYRIGKIAEVFGVTEDVLSDFVCEPYGDGLALVEYRGNKTSVVIPERIGDLPIVCVKAAFPQAVSIFLPKTVTELVPYTEEDDYADVENVSTASVSRLIEHMIGGYQSAGAVFGPAPALTTIRVDDENPLYFDLNGLLYSAAGTLVRVPPMTEEFAEGALEGVTEIGTGAFLGCRTGLEFDLPETVTVLGDGCFEGAVVPLISSYSIESIGTGAFAGATATMIIDASASEAIGAWAFKDTGRVDMISFEGEPLLVDTGAFFGSAAKLVILPDSVQVISSGAFALASRLESITLPKNLMGLGDYVFAECESLTEITLPASLRFVGESAFEGCERLFCIRYEGTRKQFRALCEENEFLDESLLSRVVCKNEPFRRLRFACKRLLRRFANWVLKTP